MRLGGESEGGRHVLNEIDRQGFMTPPPEVVVSQTKTYVCYTQFVVVPARGPPGVY